MSLFKGASIGQTLVLDKGRYSKALKEASAEARAYGKDTERATSGVKKAFSAVGKVAAGAAVAGVVAFGAAVHMGIGELNDQQKANAQTAAAIKSTGSAARVSSKHVQNLANVLLQKSGVDDQVIQSGENMLLTFVNIRNGVGKNNNIFDQGTTAALNMSVAMGTDMKSSALQVGKALNDPVKGLTKLQKIGVTFTDQQKKQVAALVKSGDTMGAQKVILKELTKEFGGSAAAYGKTTEGQLGKAREAMAGLSAQMVQALLPAFNSALRVGNRWVAQLQKWANSKDGQRTLKQLADNARKVGTALATAGKLLLRFAGYLLHHQTAVKRAAIAVAGFVLAWKTFKAVKTAVGVVNDMVIRTKLLSAGMKGASAQTRGLSAAQKAAYGTGQKLGKVWSAMKSGASAVASGAKSLVTGVASATKAMVINTATAIKNGVVWVAQKVAMVAGAVATGVMTAAQWALNVALDANPISLVVLAIAALAIGLVEAYKHVKFFHTAVDAVFGFLKSHWLLIGTILLGPIVPAVAMIVKHFGQIKAGIGAAFNWVRSNWRLILAILTGPIGIAVLVISKYWGQIKSGAQSAWGGIKAAWGSVKSFFGGIASSIGGAFSGAWSGIKNGFRTAIDYIIDKWNGLSFSIPAVNTHIPGVGKVGGFTLNTPNIGRLQRGGSVGGRGSGDIVPTLLEPGEGVLNRNAVAGLGGKAFIDWANTKWARFQTGGVVDADTLADQAGGGVSAAAMAAIIAAAHRSNPTVADLTGTQNTAKNALAASIADYTTAISTRPGLALALANAHNATLKRGRTVYGIEQSIASLKKYRAHHKLTPDQAHNIAVRLSDMAVDLKNAKGAEAKAKKAEKDAADALKKRDDRIANDIANRRDLADTIVALQQQINDAGDTAIGDGSGTIDTGTGGTITMADVLAQLKSLASSLQAAFNGEAGNVFGGITLAGDLHQHFEKQVDPTHWRESTLFHLTQAGS